jgi:hypothetical protein
MSSQAFQIDAAFERWRRMCPLSVAVKRGRWVWGEAGDSLKFGALVKSTE